MNNYCVPVGTCSLGAMQRDFVSLTIISKQWTSRRSQYKHSILFCIDEQRSNALISSCALLHVQTHNLFWRHGKGGKGAAGKSNMFSSLKNLLFLKTLPKASRLTDTRTNNRKNEQHLTTYWKSDNKIHLSSKVKDTKSSDEEGPWQLHHHYVISIYICGMQMSPVLATRAAVIPSTEKSHLFFVWVVCFFFLLTASITMVLLHISILAML